MVLYTSIYVVNRAYRLCSDVKMSALNRSMLSRHFVVKTTGMCNGH